jgi:hypothetical protein
VTDRVKQGKQDKQGKHAGQLLNRHNGKNGKNGKKASTANKSGAIEQNKAPINHCNAQHSCRELLVGPI